MILPPELDKLINNLNEHFSCADVFRIIEIIGHTNDIAIIKDWHISHPDEHGSHVILDNVPGVIIFGRLAEEQNEKK